MFKYTRVPLIFSFQEKSAYKDTYAGEIGNISLKAHLLRPEGVDAKSVAVFMHPTGGGSYLPMINSLAKQGVHTVWCDSRYRGTDSALIMEKVVVDLGNCIKFLKERNGYEKVILGGWSGGGSLSLLYQSEAENPSLIATPAGDPPNLTQEDLIPADGVMLIAAHLSRHRTFTEWLDGSVLDENDPENRDAELDIYNPKNANQPPYSSDFLRKYSEAQIARNRRITSWVKNKLEGYKIAGDLTREHAFVVHRTMADPRWLDPSIDKNERKPNWCFLGEPAVVNNSPIGLARYCSLRSWLSQWSFDDANGDGIECAKRISVPTLVIGNTADDGITPSHTNKLFDSVGHENKELHWIQGANHYYFGQSEKSQESATLCKDWMKRKNLLN
ncbi:MAG: alpha/beta hydrolase [SAR86 cluster bacterium]|nr:alpha/beta hydrolase [SAR86 cluster bacterium]